MSDWRNLPNEVLALIFQSLRPRDKTQCSLTCHAWKSAAQRALFKFLIYLNDRKMYNLATALTDCDPDQSPGNFVKTINCSLLSSSFDMELLNTIFPFLEVINISGHQRMLYEKICQIITEGGFVNLKKIPYARWDKQHIEFILTRKDYIKELELRDTYFDSGTYEVFRELPSFSKLELLSLYSSVENRKANLEDLLKYNIPTLKTIKIECNNKSNIIVDTVDINNIQPLTSVKELELFNHGLLSSGNSAFTYVMRKFPNLEKLSLSSYADPFRMRDHISPTVDCLFQFLVYLFHIRKSCKVHRFMVIQNTTELVEDFFKYASVQISKTYGNVGLHLAISLYTMDQREEDANRQDPTAYIDFVSQLDQCEVKVTYKVFPNYTLKPYLELFDKVGDINIDSLIVDCSEEKNGKSFVMDNVFENFTKLRGLVLRGIKDITFDDTSLQKKSQLNLESLGFFCCELKKEMFTEISKKCSKLKSLEIFNCYFYNDIVWQDTKAILPYVSISMKSTCLIELSFSISVEAYFNFHQYSKVFIRLKAASKKTRYCKIAVRELSDSSLETNFVDDHFNDADYKAHLKDKKCVVYSIYCESVKRFVVKSEGKKRKVLIEEDMQVVKL